MEKLFLVAVLTYVLPATCGAQGSTGCEARAALGGAVSFWTLPMSVDPVLASTGGQHGLARGAGRGIEGSAHGVFPLNRTWSGTAEFGGGRRDVEIHRLQDGTEVRRPTGDAIRFQRYSVGVMARRASDRVVCLYTAVAAGPQRFEYRGVSSVAVGVAAKIGIEVSTSSPAAFYFDLGLDAIFNVRNKLPLAEPVLAGPRPTVGVRFRFD